MSLIKNCIKFERGANDGKLNINISGAGMVIAMLLPAAIALVAVYLSK